MKLNDIDFNRLSDTELVSLCLKYKIIQKEDIKSLTRKKILDLIKNYVAQKLKVYGQKKTTL